MGDNKPKFWLLLRKILEVKVTLSLLAPRNFCQLNFVLIILCKYLIYNLSSKHRDSSEVVPRVTFLGKLSAGLLFKNHLIGSRRRIKRVHVKALRRRPCEWSLSV